METDFIKSGINLIGESMGRMERDHKPPVESLIREIAGSRQGMIKMSSLEICLEDIYSAITPVLSFLEERMRNLEVLSGGVLRN